MFLMFLYDQNVEISSPAESLHPGHTTCCLQEVDDSPDSLGTELGNRITNSVLIIGQKRVTFNFVSLFAINVALICPLILGQTRQ